MTQMPPTIEFADPDGMVVYKNQAGALSGVTSISATSTMANNLRGSLTISGDATSGEVIFTTPEDDATYFVSVTPVSFSGSPIVGSNRITSIDKTVSGLTVNVEAAPGDENSVTFDWILIR